MFDFGSFAALAIAAAVPEGRTHVVSIEARLYLEETGTFSENLLNSKASYVGWNDGIRAAPRRAVWPKGDILVTFVVHRLAETPGSELSTLIVKAVSDKKEIASRKFARLNARVAESYRMPLWLSDVGCDADIDLIANVDGEETRARLQMACGE